MHPKAAGKYIIMFTLIMVAVFLFTSLGVSGSRVFAQEIPTDTPTVEPTLTETPTLEPSTTETPGFSWELSLDYSNSSDSIDSISAMLNSLGVAFKSEALGDGSHRLILNGSGNMELIRQVIYEILLPDFNFLGGSGIVSIQTTTTSGSPITVNLESQPGTGYTWDLNAPETSTFTVQGIPTTTNRFEGPGTTALQTFVLQPSVTGQSTLELIYQRPFDKSAAVTRHLTITLPDSVSSIDLSDPNPPNTGTTEPAVDELTSQDDSPATDDIDPSSLPASFDWRTTGKVSDIRDQNGCGSCWAFGLTAVMESALRINQNTTVDLSEQFLVSCNVAAENSLCGGKYSCSGGCEDAQDYHVDTLGQGQTVVGAVLESQLPYTATDASCPAGLTHLYKAASWKFVGGVWNYTPSVTEIKNAIYTYGPVTSTVCVQGDFYSYSGGVYKTDNGNCQNHMISLVGWDDSNSTWILRNSWGTGWGESGYMRIRWGVSGVGFRVTYVTMSDNNTPTPISPSGTISDKTPTYTWTKVTGATQYRYKLVKGTTTVYTNTVSSSACGTSTCSNTPTTTLSYAAYKWKVQAYVSGAWKAYSAFMNFTVATSTAFDSQFTINASGWTPLNGTWSVGSGYYQTSGLTDKFVSSKHSNSYNVLTYEVKLSRTDTSAFSYGVFFNGAPSPINSEGWWNNGYAFLITDAGAFGIWRFDGGVWTNLLPWTTYSGITSSWNTLMVTYNSSTTYVQFYINGFRVAYGTFGSYTSGQVGVGYYRDASSSKLKVDYAKLSLTAPSSVLAGDDIFIDDAIDVGVTGDSPMMSP